MFYNSAEISTRAPKLYLGKVLTQYYVQNLIYACAVSLRVGPSPGLQACAGWETCLNLFKTNLYLQPVSLSKHMTVIFLFKNLALSVSGFWLIFSALFFLHFRHSGFGNRIQPAIFVNFNIFRNNERKERLRTLTTKLNKQILLRSNEVKFEKIIFQFGGIHK